MSFKERLKEMRIDAGMSQTDLAIMVGVTPRTIQNYEYGKRRPANVEIAARLAEALGVSVGQLLGIGAQG